MSALVVDIRKACDARLLWRNQEGSLRERKPKVTTIGGHELTSETIYGSIESQRQRASRLNLGDRWTPVLTIRMSKYHIVRFSGARALSLWKAWNERIFGQKKGKA